MSVAGAAHDALRAASCDPSDLAATARSLRAIRLRAVRPAAPAMDRNWGIDDPDSEAVGAPVPVLVSIGQTES